MFLELWLSFWSEVHYNSLYGSGGEKQNYHVLALLSQCYSVTNKTDSLLDLFTDVPTRVARKKHWLF